MIPVVKQAFERAYGEIPEGATCYFCFVNSVSGETEWGNAVIEFYTPNDPCRDRDMWIWDTEEENWISIFELCEDPIPGTQDLSKFPALHYENFCDYRYDEAVKALEAGE